MIQIRSITLYQSIITAAAVTFSYCLPDHLQYLLIVLCGILVLGFGLAHGALDHILFYVTYQNSSSRKQDLVFAGIINSNSPSVSKTYSDLNSSYLNHDIGPSVVFYSNYLFMMSAWAFSWYMYPFTSFWTFLAVSCWHFGEGDLGYLEGISHRFKGMLFMSRGALIIGLTMTCQPTVTLPIIQHLIQMPDSFFFSFSEIVPSIVCIFHFMTLWRLWCLVLFQSFPFSKSHHNSLDSNFFPVHKELLSIDNLLIETLKSTLFTTLYLFLNPLFAFSLYFGIWHGLGCIHDFIQLLKQQQWAGFAPPLKQMYRSRSISSIETTVSIKEYLLFYQLAAPYTLVSIIGMGFLYLLWELVNQGQIVVNLKLSLVWAVFIGCISVLTGGHVWVVLGMYWPEYWEADPVGMKN